MKNTRRMIGNGLIILSPFLMEIFLVWNKPTQQNLAIFYFSGPEMEMEIRMEMEMEMKNKFLE